jgi:creatinine amidohydrolase
MSDPSRWAECDRETLRAELPEAVVLLPVGATEQHGPHLATGTDALLAHTVTERAAVLADASRRLIVAPPLPFGSSDHHLPFGGTLSLSPETLLAVLLDLARSIAVQGGRRLVVINGHGGNTGICQAFAQAAAVRHGLSVGYFDYWRFAAGSGSVPGPGHAGEFETALVLAVRPELVRPPSDRADPPPLPAVDRVDVQTAGVWQSIDGYTDHPARATEENGRRWLDGIVAAAAAAFVELARTL